MASLMRRVLVLILVMGPMVVMLPGCGGSAEGTIPGGSDMAASAPRGEGAVRPASAEPKQISIDNFRYVPDTLTVPAGTKVTWTNHDDMPHTVTSTGTPKALDSEALDTDEQFSHVFVEPGTYTYRCTVHPKMLGRVIVEKR
ncbi:MAG: cupredoxin family copper-binding protein [Planctomycetaceae bacterium]|nr:cupredoxin family copper-binding protein [Planctomycetaceae bacterium]